MGNNKLRLHYLIFFFYTSVFSLLCFTSCDFFIFNFNSIHAFSFFLVFLSFFLLIFLSAYSSFFSFYSLSVCLFFFTSFRLSFFNFVLSNDLKKMSIDRCSCVNKSPIPLQPTSGTYRTRNADLCINHRPIYKALDNYKIKFYK